uniref:helix-turn-helix domain-containing protein n=1 Tax=Alistipes sp. TaxID=1872444 RepID=UPI004056736F
MARRTLSLEALGALSLIEEHVITECRALLSSTDMTIQQIADAMNFPSQSVFGKYFKRVVGVSPKGYRG